MCTPLIEPSPKGRGENINDDAQTSKKNSQSPYHQSLTNIALVPMVKCHSKGKTLPTRSSLQTIGSRQIRNRGVQQNLSQIVCHTGRQFAKQIPSKHATTLNVARTRHHIRIRLPLLLYERAHGARMMAHIRIHDEYHIPRAMLLLFKPRHSAQHYTHATQPPNQTLRIVP